MPYKHKADKKARDQRRAAALKAEAPQRPHRESHKKAPYNPGPWKSPEPKPWILKGCKP